jgi:SAM-dependent methyltransferase
VTAAPEFYHSFAALGLSFPQKAGIYALNQRCKEPYILGYLLLALAKARGRRASYRPSLLELFCADAYYALVAKRFGAGKVVAIDRDAQALASARLACATLAVDVELRRGDVRRLATSERFDVVLCAGGLYHLTNPARFLQRLRQNVRRYLVVQTVVSLEATAPDYFVTPAPGWRHGSRFSLAYLRHMLADAGFHVLHSSLNHLAANPRLADRGSAYVLCGTRTERESDAIRGFFAYAG